MEIEFCGEDRAKEGTRMAVHIRSILVPLDFSKMSLKALEYAAALAEEFDARVDLLYVMEPVSLREFAGAYPAGRDEDELVRVCKEKLGKCASEVSLRRELRGQLIVRAGPPYREITEVARTVNADVIVIATHGYSGLKHALLGSVAERVVQYASCPVLVVREKEHEFVGSGAEAGG